MADTIIKIENISKQYRLGTIGTGTFAHDVNRWWYKIRGKADPYVRISDVSLAGRKDSDEYVWALKGITFDVEQGDVLGIIGRNGAGKSTLLKILSRITTPTTGTIKVKGRIASLLEVGTGFHPELTGRENIFLNGAILGMRKTEIVSKFDEIVDFAGIEKYVDTPVKRYSSGMYVRLAFAVAAHLEPEILIVDEVLAVGDAEFQKKALGKMRDVSRREGRTVLFVSHNMGAMRQLCKKGVLLRYGAVEKSGNIDEVIRHYFQYGGGMAVKPPLAEFRTYNIKESPVTFEDVSVNGGNEVPTIRIGEEPEIHFTFRVNSRVSGANLTISLYNEEGTKVGLAFSWDDEFYINMDPGVHRVAVTLRHLSLAPGSYFIGAGINQSTQTTAWDGINSYPIFRVENQNDVTHFTQRSWGINHFSNNTWRMDYNTE
ncbi:MAG TPA: ABC transporter ATP-binding protein [Cyclobacteriaceae bacterium]|nr:ABC transporter ATP-binding protein [Cyclobacteriaceae bacterium]